ncbi:MULTISPECIES: hypothetical protein [Limnospira]|uniref:hypothetical protein n=1 Tax=Limnospira TaxID=2596745 RepID=UPI0002804626|nr:MULTISPECIES: hypothetical protein [unclassified Limnospira]EKD08778.1 hypothetical protein SPLC1_S201790 [Arthrospira platensis C1]MDY7051510.1 polyprotein [Limnospira fusiformis LS22]MDT9187979.1 polyprotein [Limnospira sp. PMC 894.15]MDT9275814.1 polyprotein [Limnospira sp. PMC 737.11]UWU45772.1 hypothetical protein APLC1_0456 [Arthrospira platensis C1]
MRTYSASGDRTVVGYITGKNGQYEVFHRTTKDLFFQNTAGGVRTGFRVHSNGKYVAPDGTIYHNNSSIIAAIQNKYDLGRYSG